MFSLDSKLVCGLELTALLQPVLGAVLVAAGRAEHSELSKGILVVCSV